jgi:prepilin-type N-terminal cleavage/methylation domain-containing protein
MSREILKLGKGAVKMHNTQPDKKGFTLIELLVVIAIIAVLVAILFPVFARARENARRASCMSNMKQIGLGIMQYVQDYDEHYPMSWYGTTSSSTKASYPQTQDGTPGKYFIICHPDTCGSSGEGNFYTWMDLIYPYVKSTQVFVCPSSQNPLESGSHIPNYWMSGAYGNYASSTMDSTDATTFATSRYGLPILHTGTPMSAVTRPSESVMVLEATGPRDVMLYLISASPTNLVYTGRDIYFKTHLEGINLTFGDGHAKWMSFNNIAAQTGAYSTTYCNLSSVTNSLPYCSKLWNPFLSQ